MQRRNIKVFDLSDYDNTRSTSSLFKDYHQVKLTPQNLEPAQTTLNT